MNTQERIINQKCNKILKKKKMKVFDGYDGNYTDPKIGDLHKQLLDPIQKRRYPERRYNDDSDDE